MNRDPNKKAMDTAERLVVKRGLKFKAACWVGSLPGTPAVKHKDERLFAILACADDGTDKWYTFTIQAGRRTLQHETVFLIKEAASQHFHHIIDNWFDPIPPLGGLTWSEYYKLRKPTLRLPGH